MNRKNVLPNTLLAMLALVCCAFIFWIQGGLRWLQNDVFPPHRPKYMPANSVWIDAPPVPLGWHRGWWFGCSVSSSGNSNYCRLVNNGEIIFSGDYLSCGTQRAIPENMLKLVPPKDSSEMWLFGENVEGVAGFTEDGDVLLPVSAIQKCKVVMNRLARQNQAK